MKKFLKKYRVRIRNSILGVLLFALICLVFIFIAYYFSYFSDNLLPKNREELGQLGDYFGGLLNPIFGLASFLALLATILYQSKELKLSRNELELTRIELANSASALDAQNRAIELQSFEQTFFSWLKNYKELLANIEGEISKKTIEDYTSQKSVRHGNAFLHEAWLWSLTAGSLRSTFIRYQVANSRASSSSNQYIYTDEVPKSIQEEIMPSHFQIKVLIDRFPDLVIRKLKEAWQSLYSQNEYKLDALFRTAYKLIVWIDTQPDYRLPIARKYFYVSIFRSQLSRAEMIFLFYNGLSEAGKKFKPLIEKYALFDNLNFKSDECMKLLACEYKENAFNSDIARAELSISKVLDQ